jgi:hypothetical protein
VQIDRNVKNSLRKWFDSVENRKVMKNPNTTQLHISKLVRGNSSNYKSKKKDCSYYRQPKCMHSKLNRIIVLELRPNLQKKKNKRNLRGCLLKKRKNSAITICLKCENYSNNDKKTNLSLPPKIQRFL